jgi:uncharacterized protein YqjF (DUF2071 family)
MFMRWHDLLFMHWSFPPELLRPVIPAKLEPDTLEGRCWIGVVPFRMSNVRARFLPPIPGASAFPELNVRTYVIAEGKPGVWFFSLDAASRLAVRAARWSFNLPYFDARMKCVRVSTSPKMVDYQSIRTHRNAAPAEFAAQYGPIGPVFRATPGSLDHFLTERYCLYSTDRRGNVYRGDIAHEPWPLQPAETRVGRNRMFDQMGISSPGAAPVLHYAERLDVIAWRPELVR